MNGKIGFVSVENEFFAPLAHLLAFPALHALFLNRQAFIGNNQIFVNSDHFPETFALRTRAHGTVEIEHQIRWFFKRDSVGFKPVGKCKRFHAVRRPKPNDTFAFSFQKRRFHRIRQAVDYRFFA